MRLIFAGSMPSWLAKQAFRQPDFPVWAALLALASGGLRQPGQKGLHRFEPTPDSPTPHPVTPRPPGGAESRFRAGRFRKQQARFLSIAGRPSQIGGPAG